MLEFFGVYVSDLYNLDRLFGVYIFVYEMNEDGKVKLIYRFVIKFNKK